MKKKSPVTATFWGAIGLLQGIAVLIWLLLIPSEGGPIFGYSFSRTLLIMVPLTYCALALFLFIIPSQKADSFSSKFKQLSHRFFRLDNSHTILYLLLTILLWLILTPAYRFNAWQYYFIRFRPLLVLLGSFLLTILLTHALQQEEKPKFTFSPKLVLISTALFAFFGITRLIGIGWQADPKYWNQPGIPFLLDDLFVSIVLFFVLTMLDKKDFLFNPQNKLQKADILIALAMVIFTAVLWLVQPIHPDSLLANPAPPSFDHFPLADAQVYDLDALNLIKNGRLGVNGVSDKPLYSIFLALLHMILPEGTYTQIGSLQIIFFAFFGALLYFLGTNLSNRISGLLLAFMGGLHAKNLLTTAWIIQTANPRLLSTDFPTLIMLTVLFFLYLKLVQEKDRLHWYVLYFGCLGLSTFLRFNFWALIPLTFMPLLFLLKKKRITYVLISIVVVVAVMLPWQIRSAAVTGNPTYFINRFVTILDQRFNIQSENIPILSLAHKDQTPITPQNDIEQSPLPTTPADLEEETAMPTTAPEPTQTPTVPLENQTTSPNNDESDGSSLPERQPPFPPILNHTIHNIITPLFMLPSVPINHDHEFLMYKNESIWWKSLLEMTGWQWIMLFFNLAVCAVGFSVIQQKNSSAGWVLLFFYLSYSFGLGAARTSGGRYIVALAAFPLVLYTAGLAALLGKLLGKMVTSTHSESEEYSSKMNPLRLIIAFVILTFFSVSMILFETNQRKDPAVYVPFNELIESINLTDQETQYLRALSKDNVLSYHSGRLYYPMLWEADSSVHYAFQIADPKPYPQLFFKILNENLKIAGVLHTQYLEGVNHGIQAATLSCKDGSYQQVFLLVIFNEDGTIQSFIPSDTAFEEIECSQ